MRACEDRARTAIVLYRTLYPQKDTLKMKRKKMAWFGNVMIVSTRLFTVVILKGQTSVIHQSNILDIEWAINEFCTVRIQCFVQLIEACQ